VEDVCQKEFFQCHFKLADKCYNKTFRLLVFVPTMQYETNGVLVLRKHTANSLVCESENAENHWVQSMILAYNNVFIDSKWGNVHDIWLFQTHSDHNRTMLFQVGRIDLRLISPDRKQILLHKHLKDVASCIQVLMDWGLWPEICA
jgi:hypothetical protein